MLTDLPWSVCIAEADTWMEIGGDEFEPDPEQEHAKAMARKPAVLAR
jgi:hypothetical protein